MRFSKKFETPEQTAPNNLRSFKIYHNRSFGGSESERLSFRLQSQVSDPIEHHDLRNPFSSKLQGVMIRTSDSEHQKKKEAFLSFSLKLEQCSKNTRDCERWPMAKWTGNQIFGWTADKLEQWNHLRRADRRLSLFGSVSFRACLSVRKILSILPSIWLWSSIGHLVWITQTA